MTTDTRIASVSSRPCSAGTLWRIRDTEGGHYSTTNGWIASLCDQALKTNRAVRLWTVEGWYDKTLTHVRVEPEQKAVSA